MATSIIKLDDTGWIALDTYSYYRIKNGIMTIIIYTTVNALTTSWQEIFTIPAQYVPKASNVGIYCPGIHLDAETLVAVEMSGSIKAKRASGSGRTLVACIISYPIN